MPSEKTAIVRVLRQHASRPLARIFLKHRREWWQVLAWQALFPD